MNVKQKKIDTPKEYKGRFSLFSVFASSRSVSACTVTYPFLAQNRLAQDNVLSRLYLTPSARKKLLRGLA